MNNYIAVDQYNDIVFKIQCLVPESWIQPMPQGYCLLEDDVGCFQYWDKNIWPSFFEFLNWCSNQQLYDEPHALLQINDEEYRWVPERMVDLLEPRIDYTPGAGFVAWREDEAVVGFPTYEEAALSIYKKNIVTLISEFKGVVDSEAFDYVLGHLHLQTTELES